VGITAPVLWLVAGIITAVSVGFSVQVAQDIGAGDIARASKVTGQSISASVLFGIALSVTGLLLSPFLPLWLGATGDVAVMASQYFTIMSISFFFNSLEMNFSSILRCTGDTTSPLIANSMAIILNIFMNWLFIFPARTITVFGRSVEVWGAGMGVAGAALGSAISIAAAAFLLIIPMFAGKRGIKIHAADIFHFDREILSRVCELGVPVGLERITLSFGQVLFMRMVSNMGTTAIAAHHLAIQAESLSYMPSFGFAVAATTLVGQSIGADDRPRAKRFGTIASNMGAIGMTITGLMLFFLAEPIIALFTHDANVIKLGGVLVRIVAFAQPMEAYATIYAGALRGAGDSRWPFYINLVGVWGFRIGLSVIFVFVFKWGLPSLWFAMLVDITFRGIICRKRFLNNILR
ncbi:MAG: MATE family efflux transporter, partial [Angelakisella sp.]